MDKILSIIIPVYNIDAYLHQCIDSLLCDRDNYEIILIDDGSIDHSSRICDEYAAQYKQITTYHKSNGGVSSARNMGMGIATGKYLYFVDGDDWVENIEKMIDVLGANKFDGDFIINYRIFNKKDHVVSSVNYRQTCINVNDLSRFKTLHFHALWGFVLRKEIVHDNGFLFNTNLKYAEDWVFIMQYLALIPRLYKIDDFYYCYRKEREGSAMNQSYSTEQVMLHLKAYDLIWAIKTTQNNEHFIDHEKRSCFSYVLNVFKSNLNILDIRLVQRLIRKRFNLKLLFGNNLKSFIKIIVANINIKLLKYV